MFKKIDEKETAANWQFVKQRGRLYVAALIIPALLLFWLSGYGKGVFDGQADCTIFQSRCDGKMESEQ